MEWKDYLAKLAAKGVSQSQIAREVGCGQATISDLALGKTREPRTSLGMALLRIGERCGVQIPGGIAPTGEPRVPLRTPSSPRRMPPDPLSTPSQESA